MTRKGRASSCVWTSTVTLRSCMHSSRPDCVLGDARLISSTSTRLANTGPGRKSKRPSRELKTVVPTTSAGSRSAVHWMRAYCARTERANARASAVLPTPGWSSTSTWPSASNATSTSLTTSSAALTARPTLVRRRSPSDATAAGSRRGGLVTDRDVSDRARLRARRLLAAGELAHRRLGVGRPHERLAHEHRVDPHAFELLDVGAGGDPRLGDHGLACGDVGEQLERAPEVDAEVRQVAVVDPHDVDVELERGLELALVVDLDERVEVELARLGVQLRELAGPERANHQQHRVGARHLGLDELVAVDGEVLAQHGQVGGGDRLAQVVERAAEVLLLGQDRQGGRTAALVGPGDLANLRALADHPGRRRAALVLGDHRGSGLRQGLPEGTALAPGLDLPLELRERPLAPALLEPLAGRREDALEPHAHAAGASRRLASRYRSSTASAAPESIARSAARTPPIRSSAAPAT